VVGALARTHEPDKFVLTLPEAMTDAAHRRFAMSEATTAFQGLYQSAVVVS
jgi:hypothetical protein